MELKRNVKAKLCYNVSLRNQDSPTELTKWFKYRLKKSFGRVHCGTREFLGHFELWGSTIKSIEGRFGTGVATYFRFLRSLFILNLCVFIMRYFFSSCLVCRWSNFIYFAASLFWFFHSSWTDFMTGSQSMLLHQVFDSKMS
jgi:hypothetical protein